VLLWDGSCKGHVGPAALIGAYELHAVVTVTPAAAKTVVLDNPSQFKSCMTGRARSGFYGSVLSPAP
jgi:hypothetical protein